MKNLRHLLTVLLMLYGTLLLAERPIVENPIAESMTLDQAFEHVITFEDGQSRQPVRFIERNVYLATAKPDRRADMTDRLLNLLQLPKATGRARQLACQWLYLVDDIAAVPMLSAMLDTPGTFEMALGALEPYESQEADQALLQALDRCAGNQQAAIIGALGRRGHEPAVEPLASLLQSNDAEVSKAAAVSLGIIGNTEAVQQLLHADNIPKEIREDALLRCALQLQRAKKTNEAEQVYRFLWEQKSPAGLIGLVSLQKQQARAELLEAIRSDDPLLAKTAINLSGTLSDTAIENELIALLSIVSPDYKIALIRMFADQRKTAALGAIADELFCEDDRVFLAAVQALGQLGNASSIEPLAHFASTQGGARRKAARKSLVLLDGADVDNTFRQMIRTGEPTVRAELIQAAINRKIPLESEDLWAIVQRRDEPKDARREAIDALVKIPQADTYRELIVFWSQLDDMSLSQTIKVAVTQLGLQLPEETRSEPLRQALQGNLPPEVMGQMLAVAGHFDHPDFINILRSSLQDPNVAIQLEAVRALVSWPDNEGNDELIKVAATSSNATQRVLAQRALLARSESNLLSLTERITLLEALSGTDAAETVKQQAGALHKKLKQELAESRIE